MRSARGSVRTRQIAVVGTLILMAFALWGLTHGVRKPERRIPKPAEGPVRVYALWQPTAGGRYVKADGPIGGDMILRVVVKASEVQGSQLEVVSAAITEQENEVHRTGRRKLAASFAVAEQNTVWGDPSDAVVLQSAPVPTAGYHNFTHTVDIKLRSDSRILTGSMDLVFRNLVLTDTTTPGDIVPFMDKTTRRIQLACRLDHAQQGTCAVKYEVFSVDENKTPVAVHLCRNVLRPGAHSWRWDGITSAGTQAYGLYTYRITASTAMAGDVDSNRSPYLRIGSAMSANGKVSLFADRTGIVDHGILDRIVPPTETYSRGWRLFDTQDKPATSGKVWMYTYDQDLVMVTDVAEFACTVHPRQPRGLMASRRGVDHNLTTTMHAGRFVGGAFWILLLEDGHADLYRDHKPRSAVPLR